jgi:predicted AlkP superfamily pyrophosphatase or phosphodiesterase
LVVVLVVDQMRADYLERFGGLFTGGFARLLQDGAVFTDARHDHAATYTAVGHATISTGVYPARHGIVGNEFFDREENREVYNSLDDQAPLLGDPEAPGRSPNRLLREGFGDWLKRASPDSKVFSVSIKDRAAIMMGAKQPDGVYWYHPSARGFVTSTYYESEYPDWVDAFNGSGLVDSYFARTWTRLLEPEAYTASREDSFPIESGGRNFTFPYDLSVFDDGSGAPNQSYYSFLRRTPFGDEFTLEFARAIVTNENLGADDAPDILIVAASAADYIGHRWGPYSQEVQDHYLRLDGYLDSFFAFLNETVGAANYAVVLSGDHGVAAAPEEMARRGLDAQRIAPAVFRATVINALEGGVEALGLEEQPGISYLEGLLLEFRDQRESDAWGSRFRAALATRLRDASFLLDAVSAEQVAAADLEGDAVISMFRRSYHPSRSPDVMLHMKPYYLLSGDIATHGSAHIYDRHVPLIFLGNGYEPGWHTDQVRTVDIAPTLATLLGLDVPDDVDGVVLEAAFREEAPQRRTTNHSASRSTVTWDMGFRSRDDRTSPAGGYRRKAVAGGVMGSQTVLR